MCLTWPRARLPTGDGIDWSIGQAFLRTVYSVWSFGIDGKEPPMLGLYALANASAPAPASTSAVATATVATTLPNFFLPTPTPSAPAWLFNASFTPAPGAVVGSDLGASTYTPLLAASGTLHPNAYGLLTVEAGTPVTVTDAAGTHTSLSRSPVSSVALGHIPGTSNAAAASASVPPLSFLLLVVLLSYL
jgi:hypothetical protein